MNDRNGRGDHAPRRGGKNTRGSRPGFTLVELLVVIAIVGIMLALMLPAIGAVRETARRMQCGSRLREIGTALTNYHSQHETYPPGSHRHGKLQIAWSAYLLPHVEQGAAGDAFHYDSPFISAENRAAAGAVIPLYLCPSTSRRTWDRDGDRIRRPTDGDFAGRGATDYGGVFGSGLAEPINNGVLIYDVPVRRQDVHDGLTHTAIVVEDTGRGFQWDGEWANGGNVLAVETGINRQQDNEMWSDHPGGAQMLLCAGAVRFLIADMDVEVLGALCHRGDGR